MTAAEHAKMAVGTCTHASQWLDTSLVACERCVAAEIQKAVAEEREAIADLVLERWKCCCYQEDFCSGEADYPAECAAAIRERK